MLQDASPQRTLPLEAPAPQRSTKRKPSARAPWQDHEIPVILDALKGRYRVRNQALIACNVVWGLRAHEMLDVRLGDILTIAPDGSWTYKESFEMSGPRLKGGKPRKPWQPKPKPKGHGKACPCNLCHQKEPKRSAPEIRHLEILPGMHAYLTPWIEEVQARVGKLTPELYLWLSRKRNKDGTWRAISRQAFWAIVVEACKIAEPIINDPTFCWQDYGTHSCRKTVATAFEDIEEAQHYLGHKDSSTTARYRLANPREVRKSALKLGVRLLPPKAA